MSISTPVFTAQTDRLAPDPAKHVRYTQGMVLGVDDFTQDFAYLDNRDQWHARETIGYGTVTGLHVGWHPKDGGHEIAVSPGVALSPRGQLIRVTTAQCAMIEAWLQLETTRTRLAELGIGASSAFNAYVVLCYRDCPVDELPVPGEPCRCDSETMAPSRILDDFRLELTLQAPPQREEDAVRELVAWIRSLPVQDFNPAAGELEAFLDALRSEFQNLLSSPPTSLGSPPASPPETLRIPRGQLCEWLRAALRLWVTELRPKWQEEWRARAGGACHCGCGGDPSCHGTGDPLPEQGRECLLLAQVNITRGSGTVTSVTLDEEKRPFLVHLRMLQELVLCGRGRGQLAGRTFGTAFTMDANSIRLWIHYPEPVAVSEAAMTLWLNRIEQAEFAVSAVHANVYNIDLPGSPPDLLAPGVTIEIRLDAQLLTDPAGRDLATVFASAGYRFNDYEEPTIRVYGYADTVPPVPVPNDALIVAENVFAATAKPPTPGVSPHYARADHTHGLPPNPIPPHLSDVTGHLNHQIGGDVTQTLGDTFIARLQKVPVDAPDPKPDQVLQFDKVRKAWLAKTLTIPGGVTPNDAVLKAENAFSAAAIAPNAGVSANFARADHTHGLPPNPIPPHVANLTAHANHQIAGDVEDTIGDNRIARLQDVTVDTNNPGAGDVLQIIERNGKPVWVNRKATGGGNGDAVLHPTGLGPYMIVAAGILDIPREVVRPSYNQLRFKVVGDNVVDLDFGPAAGTTPAERYMRPGDDFRFTYIVKGHSMHDKVTFSGFLHVNSFRASGIRVEFVPGLISDAPIQSAMIEISLFGRF